MDDPSVSIIIPTYNRHEILFRSLAGLKQQTYPPRQFEVIVVDDGSRESVCEALSPDEYPFTLRCIRQANQGATVARNHGAEQSVGEYLVFMDDDIVLQSNALQTLIEELRRRPKTIVLAALQLPSSFLATSPFAAYVAQSASENRGGKTIPFQGCMTGALAIRRSGFFELGMFQDPTGGWPNWDDVDFGYRATQAGYQCWRSANAIAEHWDYAGADLSVACQRSYRAALSAPKLFQTHPAIRDALPMFYDKTPVVWGQDSPKVIIRKSARRVASFRASSWVMVQIVRILEMRYPSIKLLYPLYRWIIGGCIFRGYRAGLKRLT